MSNKNNKILTNPHQNLMSNLEENVLNVHSSQEKVGIKSNERLPNSVDLISNESSNGLNNLGNFKNQGENENSQLDSNHVIQTNNSVEAKENKMEASGDNILPSTCIMLDTDWGSKVFVVGTAHFSEESQEDVARVIRAVQPNFIVLELCKSRYHILHWEEEEILKIAEKMDFDVMRETIKTYGVVYGIMHLLFITMSARITRELGMAPGGEFRRALKEGSNVPGCVIQLGDRPIEITLRRAFANLTWWQSLKLAWHILFEKEKIEKEDVEKCKKTDYLEEMLEMLGKEFPTLKNVLVNERDLFLSYSLMTASTLNNGPQGIVPNTVVGVVGIGHLAGIQKNWRKIGPAEVGQILQIPPPSKTYRFFKIATRASFWCLALYGFHKLASKTESYALLVQYFKR